jgi:cyanophycinase
VAGPIALVGSGEYTPAMLEIERDLLAGQPRRYVQIPTAAAGEGARRLSYWVELGQAQAKRLDVEAVPLVVTTREQADDPKVVAKLAGAGLIYLSGGDPGRLADTLRQTALWHAIVEAWQGGVALAGCSAGAMAFGDRVADLRHPAGGNRPGLGLLPQLRVIPHFDRMLGWMPDLLTRTLIRAPAGVSVVGIDEQTALVGGPETFTVAGRRSAWILGDGRRRELPVGAQAHFPAIPSS